MRKQSGPEVFRITGARQGLADDVRMYSPRLAYDGFIPVAPHRVAGDVRARLDQRAVDLPQSLELLLTLLDRPLSAAAAERAGAESAVGVGRGLRSPRGRRGRNRRTGSAAARVCT